MLVASFSHADPRRTFNLTYRTANTRPIKGSGLLFAASKQHDTQLDEHARYAGWELQTLESK